MSALTPSETLEFVKTAIRCKQIPYIGGPPGIGKSELVANIANSFSRILIDVRLSQMLPEDLTGLPRYNKETGRASYAPFDTFPMEFDEQPEGTDGWLIFLDELSSASEEVMAAIYSLLLGHRIGGKKLHPNAIIVAAGNRSTDSAIARPLVDTLITRMLVCEMKPDTNDWLAWAINQPNARQDVIQFIREQPDMLYSTTDANDRGELETFATPRGWGRVFPIMNRNDIARQALGNPDNDTTLSEMDTVLNVKRKQIPAVLPVTTHLLKAAVGVFAAKAFSEYVELANEIPYPYEIAQGAATAVLPPSAAARTSMLPDLAEYYVTNIDSPASNQILRYMNRMQSEHKALFINEVKGLLGDTASAEGKLKKISERLAVVVTNNHPDPANVPTSIIPNSAPGTPGKPYSIPLGFPFTVMGGKWSCGSVNGVFMRQKDPVTNSSIFLAYDANLNKFIKTKMLLAPEKAENQTDDVILVTDPTGISAQDLNDTDKG